MAAVPDRGMAERFEEVGFAGARRPAYPGRCSVPGAATQESLVGSGCSGQGDVPIRPIELRALDFQLEASAKISAKKFGEKGRYEPTLDGLAR